jgi:hypothetical protein
VKYGSSVRVSATPFSSTYVYCSIASSGTAGSMLYSALCPTSTRPPSWRIVPSNGEPEDLGFWFGVFASEMGTRL